MLRNCYCGSGRFVSCQVCQVNVDALRLRCSGITLMCSRRIDTVLNTGEIAEYGCKLLFQIFYCNSAVKLVTVYYLNFLDGHVIVDSRGGC